MPFYPSLNTVSFLPAEELPEFMRESAVAGIGVTIIVDPEVIPHFGDSSLSVQTESGSIKAETNLTFITSEDIDISKPLCFIVETHTQERFAIGAFEPPYPVIKKIRDTGSSPKDRHACTYTVTWPSVPAKATVWLPSDAYLQSGT